MDSSIRKIILESQYNSYELDPLDTIDMFSLQHEIERHSDVQRHILSYTCGNENISIDKLICHYLYGW